MISLQNINFSNKFSRYEMKYILRKDLSNIIQKEIRNFMIYDGYATKKNSKGYFVRSLYFDSENCSNFNEKVDGVRSRYKFRIRTYSNEHNENYPIFLELKGRENKRTYKIRTPIKFYDLHLFNNNKKFVKLLNIYKNNQLIEKFVFDSYKKKCFPKLIVDYERSPYINKNGYYFRLTFDTKIKGTKSNQLFNDNKKNQTVDCISGYTVLELKFDIAIPTWFQRIIQCYQLRVVSISKYVLGADTLGLASDYEGK
jgi:hypothetical protein